MTGVYEKEFGGYPNEQAYCSPYTLLRLFADIAEGMPDKLLYLDVDILFNRDITLLYDIDVSEYEYVAAREHYGKYLLNPNYINAGVLLFNMKKIKQSGLSMDTALQKGNFVLIYPEQSMWWNYRKPKPLKKGAYTFAARNNVPVLPCFITVEDSDILGNDGFYVQEYTIHIGKPNYPDPNNSKINLTRRKLCVYNTLNRIIVCNRK